METRTVSIPGISCGHCKKTIEAELADVAGVKHVAVDVAAKTAHIEWEKPADWAGIASVLEEIGYPAEAAPAAAVQSVAKH